MVGIAKTERANKNRQSQHWAQDVERREKQSNSEENKDDQHEHHQHFLNKLLSC